MKRITIASIVEAINKGTFIFQEDWERNWNAQPLQGRYYYVGRPRSGSGFAHAIQWSPRKRQLSVWRFPFSAGESEHLLKPGVAAARRLTRLIKDKLDAKPASPGSAKGGGFTCGCRCC